MNVDLDSPAEDLEEEFSGEDPNPALKLSTEFLDHDPYPQKNPANIKKKTPHIPLPSWSDSDDEKTPHKPLPSWCDSDEGLQIIEVKRSTSKEDLLSDSEESTSEGKKNPFKG